MVFRESPGHQGSLEAQGNQDWLVSRVKEGRLDRPVCQAWENLDLMDYLENQELLAARVNLAHLVFLGDLECLVSESQGIQVLKVTKDIMAYLVHLEVKGRKVMEVNQG